VRHEGFRLRTPLPPAANAVNAPAGGAPIRRVPSIEVAVQLGEVVCRLGDYDCGGFVIPQI